MSRVTLKILTPLVRDVDGSNQPNGRKKRHLFGMPVEGRKPIDGRVALYLDDKSQLAHTGTFGHETTTAQAANGRSSHTWFGLPVWSSYEDMPPRGGGSRGEPVKVGAYWATQKDGPRIMYADGQLKHDARERLVTRIIAKLAAANGRNRMTLAGVQAGIIPQVAREYTQYSREQEAQRRARATAAKAAAVAGATAAGVAAPAVAPATPAGTTPQRNTTAAAAAPAPPREAKPKRYATTIRGRNVAVPADAMKIIMKHFPDPEEAADVYAQTKPAIRESGWGHLLVANANVWPRVYWAWDGSAKKHWPLTEQDMRRGARQNLAGQVRPATQTNVNDRNAATAKRARLVAKQGWTGDVYNVPVFIRKIDGADVVVAIGAIDGANDGPDVVTTLVSIPRATMDLVRQRLAALRPHPNRSDAHVAEAYVRSYVRTRYRQADADRGANFDFSRDMYVDPAGAEVDGATFVRLYNERRAKNNARGATANNDNRRQNRQSDAAYLGSGVNLANPMLEATKATNVAMTHAQDVVIRVAQSMEASRTAVDRRVLEQLRRLNDPLLDKYPDFAGWLRALFQIQGGLAARPLLTGNVGTPGSRVSPFRELEDQTGDGCGRQKETWKIMQGASLMVHQSVVFTMANLRATGNIQTPGLLALHSVGAGKTVAGLSAMVAFWNTDWAILPVSVRSNQDGNNLDKLAEEAVTYFPWFRDASGGYPFAAGKQAARKALVARLQASHRSLGAKAAVTDTHLLATVTTMLNDLEKYRYRKPLQKCLFIVDEIQMLVSPPPTEMQYQAKFLQFIELLKARDARSTWVLGMTATPGETTEQVESVLRMIKGSAVAAFATDADIRANARGIVSFAYVTGDLTRHAKVTVVHECLPLDAFNTAKHVNYTTLYYKQLSLLEETAQAVPEGYLRRVGRPRKSPGPQYTTYDARQKAKFWARVRQKTEYIVVNQSGLHVFDEEDQTDDTENDQNGIQDADDLKEKLEAAAVNPNMPVVKARSTTLGAKTPPRENYYVLSPKLVGVIRSILSQGGVHYVYSIDARSLRLIAHILDTRYGFTMYPSASSSSAYTLSPAKRYCFIDPTTPGTFAMWDIATQRYVMQREVTPADVAMMKGTRGGVLMADDNASGAVCSVILATKSSYKGVDVRHVRHIHAISVLPDYIDTLQLVGRGPRNCGHKKLVPSKRLVTFHYWKFVPSSKSRLCPTNATLLKVYPDCLLERRAMRAYDDGYARLDRALADVAVDRLLFATFGEAAKNLHTALRAPCMRTQVPALTTTEASASGKRKRTDEETLRTLKARLRVDDKRARTNPNANNTARVTQLQNKIAALKSRINAV